MIRSIERKDKENWIKLYCGYAKFYKVSMNNEILNTLWNWIHDGNHIVNCICYELEGKIVGLAESGNLLVQLPSGKQQSFAALARSRFQPPTLKNSWTQSKRFTPCSGLLRAEKSLGSEQAEASPCSGSLPLFQATACGQPTPMANALCAPKMFPQWKQIR